MFTALHSVVYVQCMCGSNKMYTPSIVFVHNEIMCALLLQSTHSFVMYKHSGNQDKNVLNINHASRVGKKKYSNKTTKH